MFSFLKYSKIYSTSLSGTSFQERLSKFIPYSEIPADFENYGDILQNFTNVIKSLILFDRPGPVMTIYGFDDKQPNACK